MNNKYIFSQLLFFWAFNVFCQHGEFISMEEVTLEDNLFQIQWMNEINNAEKEIIRLGLASQNTDVQIEAIKALSIHHLEEFNSELSKFERHAISSISSKISSIILEGFQQDQDGFYQYLISRAVEADLTLSKRKISHGGTSASDVLVSILTIVKCKNIRLNKETSFYLPESWLSEYQKLVLSFSELSEEDAIDQIFSKVLNTNKAFVFEYDLLKVLNSYGLSATSKTVNNITNKDSLKQSSPYGRIILLNNLKQNVRLLSAEDKQRIRNLLDDKNTRAKYFEIPSSLKVLSIILEEHIQPEINYDNIQSRLKVLGDPQKKEEMLKSLMKKIKKNRGVKESDSIPQESRAPSFSRPEERGEDFSFKENQELVKYLDVSNDKIEQRKAAYELGNRYIQDNYQPTDVDKQIIKKAIDSYFDMAKSSDSNVREEGRFQIHRLWHLAVPTLLDYLKDDDLTKMELAAKSLILMRNEEII